MERFVNPEKEVLVNIKGKDVIIEKKYADQIMSLFFYFNDNGYLKVRCDTNKFKKVFPEIKMISTRIGIHSIMCFLKYQDMTEKEKEANPIPINPVVNHINRNIYDNAFKNLEYTTHFMNSSYYSSNRKNGCYYYKKGNNHYYQIKKYIKHHRYTIVDIRDDYKRFKYELFASWLSRFLDTLVLQNKSLVYIKTYAQFEYTCFKQFNRIPI